MKLTAKWLAPIYFAAFAGQLVADIRGISGYKVERFYKHPCQNEIITSFDWDINSNLYYSIGDPYWRPAFSGVWRYDGAILSGIYFKMDVFAAARLTAIAGFIYFKDGGTTNQLAANYHRYDPSGTEAPVDTGVASDFPELATRNGHDVWAMGGTPAAIHYSAVNAAGEWTSNPLINLGTVGGSAGPLAFDADGNLYHAQDYNVASPMMYRWSAAEIAAAIADPVNAPLRQEGRVWAALLGGYGGSGMAVDDQGHPLVTTTLGFNMGSDLHRMFVYNNTCVGCDILARSTAHMNTLRIRNGQIYVNAADGIFTVTPDKTLRITAQAGADGKVLRLGFNDGGQVMRVSTIAGETAHWVLRDMDGNRLLLQAGDGGAVSIAELNDAHHVTNFVNVAGALPGWIARALDGNRILAQQGDGGMVVIQYLGPGHTPAELKVVTRTVPGWRARDLDGRRILAQKSNSRDVVVAHLDANDAPTAIHTVRCGWGWTAHSLSGNLLLMQDADIGIIMIMELDDNLNIGLRLMLRPLSGWTLIGLDVD